MTVDYMAGIGIFLLAVAFVFQFMYSLLIPFQSSSDEVTLAADRASAVLVERMLNTNTGALNVIDQGKLYYFNNTKLNYSNQMAYDNNISELGLFSDDATTIFDLNISIANLTSPDNPMNQSGPVLPENIDIGQTKRLVLIVNSSTGYSETAILSVRVW